MKKKVVLSCIGIWACVLVGCSSVSVKLQSPVSKQTLSDLKEIAEQYYSGQSPVELEGAVKRAEKLAPNSAVYHELAADLAYLNGDKDGRYTHLLQALMAPQNDVAEIHIHEFYEMSWTLKQTVRAENAFELLMNSHPNPEVRALAAHYFSLMLHRKGLVEEATYIRENIGWAVPFSVIGTWDNEQGKGFEISYPPEDEIDLKATYKGQTVDVTWRDVKKRGIQGEVDLSQIMYPKSSAVAYLASGFKAASAGEYELRITSTDGIKVWLNGGLIFNESRVGSWNYDSLVVPVRLNKGVNNLLIKTAQESSGWDIFARITKQGGAPLKENELLKVAADTKIAAPLVESSVVDVSDIIKGYVAKMKEGTAREHYFQLAYATRLGLAVKRADLSERYMNDYPGSLRGKIELAFSLWDNQERGRTADVLNELVEEAGNDFLLIMLKQIRFWQQNDLDKNAREATFALHEKYPDNPSVWMALVKLYASEGWTEDKCMTLEKVNKKFKGWVHAMYSLAECYDSLDMPLEQKQIYDELLSEFPNDYGLMNNMVSYALDAFDFGEAIYWLEKMIAAWPERGSLKSRLAQIHRQLGNHEEALELWEELKKYSPDSPYVYSKIASLSYLQKDKKRAVENWRQSLERNPDNGALAERLAYLAPKDKEPWENDVPSLEDLMAAVSSRDEMKFDSSADTALMLDHCVTDLQDDGSSINVTTTIIHSLNVSGRDSITEFRVPCYGFSRILHAFSIDPTGKRSEASSIRGKTIRFRQLDVGSTIVVQNRCEQSADGLIGDYFSYKWSFQSFNRQFVDSEFVLWMPKNTKLNEFIRGDIKREEAAQDGYKRISWRGQNTPILKSESSMPSTADIAWYLQVSTVPDWGLFLKWEDALLKDAFRVSPEVTQLANQLFEGKKTKQEKLFAIHSYLLNEIRYQQDYEDYIAGVKPHTAPQVIARGYGDCKDKSVLFITLAQLAGIEARFALVRTRNFGQIIKEVPSQQFNHAIVYVPKQEGIEEARFFDATADAFDVDVLRTDDPGTWSLVLNRKNMTFDWIKIPFQSPAMNMGAEAITLTIAEDGNATGEVEFTFKGYLASIFRQTSRNKEKFGKILQVVTDSVLKGATIEKVNVDDIDKVEVPVHFSLNIKADNFARVSEDELRFKVPFDARPEKLFALENREHPMLLGVPNLSQWKMTFALPAGATVSKIPDAFEIATDCIQFKREIVATEAGSISVVQQLSYTCERIEPSDYPMYRKEIYKLRNALDKDVVVTLKK